MNKIIKNILISICIAFTLSACQLSKSIPTKESRLLIVDYHTGQTIRSIGDIKTQESPCSTFKIALSLMGFDAGILKDENTPEWPYKDEYNVLFDSWKQPHAPKAWIANSCIWYSQVLTAQFGMERFQNYVKSFEYGNQDVSGNPGLNDGLSKSWLCSSLKISPLEQIEFIKNLLNKTLPVSKYAHEQTQKLLYNSDIADGWKLYAKTGGGIDQSASSGSPTSHSWLVGWAINETRNKQTYIFASLVKSNDEDVAANKALAKQNVLDELAK